MVLAGLSPVNIYSKSSVNTVVKGVPRIVYAVWGIAHKEMLNMARISRKEAEAQEYATAEAETKYYDMLYNFFGVVSRANEQSFAGYQPRILRNTLESRQQPSVISHD